MSIHTQLELNTLGALSVHVDKNPKDGGRTNVGSVPRNVSVRGHV